jgi:hypothetical protein
MLQTAGKSKTFRKPVRIGPEDHGRRMSLDLFADTIAQEGYLYELGNGVIEVSDIPQPSHGMLMQETRNQLVVYRIAHPGAIDFVGGGGEAKMLIGPAQSERHPDISIYLSPPPAVEFDANSSGVFARSEASAGGEVIDLRSSVLPGRA